MTENKQKQIFEAMKDAIRLILTITGFSPIAIAWQLWRNDDLWAHVALNVCALMLGYIWGWWHAFALLHAIIIIFAYGWKDGQKWTH